METAPNEVKCRIPAQGTNPSLSQISIASNGVAFPSFANFTYDTAATPTVSSISPVSSTAGQLLTISGSNFVTGQTSVTIGGVTCATTSVSSTSITCTVGSSPAGNQPVVVTVSSVGVSNSDVQFQYELQVTNVSPAEGSYGGGQLVTVSGDGFNASSISVTVCGQPCQTVSITASTQLTCMTPVVSISTGDRACNLTVSVGGLSKNIAYVYRANLTATVTSISPSRGGTGGGTTLTINGTNFP